MEGRQDGIAAFSERQLKFLMQEHEAMQQKIRYAIEDLAKVEMFIPIAIAGIYAWLLGDGNPITKLNVWLLFLPTLLSILGALRQRARYRYISVIEEYVQKIENAFFQSSKSGPWGWEIYYRQYNPPDHRYLRLAFWLFLIFGSLSFGIVQFKEVTA